MDIKVLELATQLTSKAMGPESAGTGNALWIGHEDKIAAFLQKIATKLDELYHSGKPSH